MFCRTLHRNLDLAQPITFYARDEEHLKDRIRLWMDQNDCDGLSYIIWEDVHTFARMNCEEMQEFQDWDENWTDEDLLQAVIFWRWEGWNRFAWTLKFSPDQHHTEEGWELYNPQERIWYTYLCQDYGFVDVLQVSDSRKKKERSAWAWLDAQNDFLNEVFR